MYRQFVVGRYRIDLYIKDFKLAIGCDEFNHRDRDSYEEREREGFLRAGLNCEFIRFDPDARDFSIFAMLGKIHKYMLKRTLERQRISGYNTGRPVGLSNVTTLRNWIIIYKNCWLILSIKITRNFTAE